MARAKNGVDKEAAVEREDLKQDASEIDTASEKAPEVKEPEEKEPEVKEPEEKVGDKSLEARLAAVSLSFPDGDPRVFMTPAQSAEYTRKCKLQLLKDQG